MKLLVAAHSDAGLTRDQNEDAYLTSLPLVAVADGVGGHQAGEVASRLAIQILESWKDRLRRGGPRYLEQAAVDAHRTIYSKSLKDPQLAGMATTLTCAWVEGGTVHIAHVGDSRAYLYRSGTLTQLTEDHTVVQQLVKEGRLTPEDAYRHPYRNRIFQALGGDVEIVVDLLRADLRLGDRLLLCSDGLTDELAPSDVKGFLETVPDAEQACRALVSAANAAGGNDNITVVILEPTDNGEDASPPGL